MTDTVTPQPEADEEAFERMLEKHAEPGPEVQDAVAELEAALAVRHASR